MSKQVNLTLHTLSLRQRMGLGLALLVLPLLLIAFSGFLLFHLALEKIDESYLDIDQKYIPIAGLQETLLRAAMPANDYLIHGDRDERRQFQLLRTEANEAFEQALAVPFQEPRKHAYVVKAQALWIEAARLSDEILAMERPRENPAGAQMMERMDGLVGEAYDQLEHVCLATVAELASKHEVLHQLYLKIGVGIVAFVIMVTILIFVGSLLIRRWVIAPLSELENGAQEYAAGRLEYRIPVHSNDEIGSVARTFNAMASALRRDRDILRNLSIHDQLTGLLNRKEFQRLLDLEIARSQRHGRVLALLMIDVDYFKSVNDRYGHPAGDSVLRSVADRIFTALRPNDVVARYGGEEFVVMLPETDATGAVAIAERLCEQMRATPMDISVDIQPVVTVSVGIAVYPHDADTAESLIAAADQGLYAAKAAGRNRCSQHAELLLSIN